MAQHSPLSAAIQRIVELLPSSVVDQLLRDLAEIEDINYPAARVRIMESVVNPVARNLVNELLELWLVDHPHLTGYAVSLALESANAVAKSCRSRQNVEIVWTGPIIHEVNFRGTQSVLLELIQSAEQHLHVVSFAVYKATSVIDALLQAIDRGVSVSIYIERPNNAATNVQYDPRKALGTVLPQKARVYSWSVGKRLDSSNTKVGVLHAKALVADSERVFISSANLTEYAMSKNIELGVLVKNRSAAQRIEKQLRLLIESGVFILD